MKLWPFRTDTIDIAPPFELPSAHTTRACPRCHDNTQTIPTGAVCDECAAGLRDLTAAEAWANHLDDPDELRRQLAETTVERDELAAALDLRRPAPDPDTLGQLLKQAWYRPRAGAQLQWDHDARWAAVAETAIDYTRGLWPLPADVVAVLDAEADRRLNVWPVEPNPPNVVGGGECAADTPAATGAPTPDDTHLSHQARQHLEALARALCAHDEHHTGLTWDAARPGCHESYRGLAHAVALAGWRPPTTTGATP